MARRASITWPLPDDDHPAVLIGWKGPWAQLQQFGWQLLERQPGALRILRYPGDGARDLLVLPVHPDMEDRCRQLGARAGLQTQKLTLQPRELDLHFYPFTLRSVDLPAADPSVRWLPRISPEAERNAAGLYVLVDSADARYAQHLLTETSVDVQVYALQHTCATYCRVWPALAHAFATHGVTIRPAHGFPHGSVPLAAVSESDGTQGEVIRFTSLSRKELGDRIYTITRRALPSGFGSCQISLSSYGWSREHPTQDHQRGAQPERALSLGGQRRRESVHRDPAAARGATGELVIYDESAELTQ